MPSLGARIDLVRSRHRLAVPAQMLSTEQLMAGGDQRKKKGGGGGGGRLLAFWNKSHTHTTKG